MFLLITSEKQTVRQETARCRVISTTTL